MSNRRNNGYAQESRLVYTLDYRDEPPTGQAEYPGSNQRDGQDDSNDRKFVRWLERIDQDAATAYAKRHDLTEYPPEKREAVLAAHVEAFNMSHGSRGLERLQGAADLSSTIYGPMTDRVETMEAQGQTGWAVSTQGLERHREMFADTLYASQPDPAYVNMLNRQMEQANAYSQGRQTDPERIEFRTVKNQPDEALREIVIGSLVSQNMSEAFNAVVHLEAAGDPRVEGAMEAASAVSGIYREGLNGTLEKNEEETFQRIAKQAESHGAQFALEIHEQAGFVQKEGYEQPQPPETFDGTGPNRANFRGIDQAQNYIDQVHTALDDISWQRGEMNPTYHAAARGLAEDFERTLETARESQGVLDIREDYRRMDRLAQGITFLTRPA